MSYQVLARKWRPSTFEEMVGQEHVLRALTNALTQQRLHHAYLFTGTRGVGKTTLARILAKCLNCEQGVTATPCGKCESCQAISQGRFVDLIEVDAASRTKVEDTRELLDNVQYAPTAGRYKIYLIDEVHMLSGHSFNALLKTLEEPPEHVIFLLATTDPQRLPVTVLSRCLQFHLKNLSIDLIAAQLQHILSEEKIKAEPAALRQLARAAEGSLRDALSLLDQAIAFGNETVMETDVSAMLGTMERGDVQGLIDALIASDANGMLGYTAQLAEKGLDYDDVLATLAATLQQIATHQVLPEAQLDTELSTEQLKQWAQSLSAEDVQLFYQIAVNGRRDLPLAPDPKTGFEMTLLRMLAFSIAAPVAAPAPASVPTPAPAKKPEKPIAASAAMPVAPVAPVEAVAAPPAPSVAPAETTAAPAPATNTTLTPADWSALVAKLTLTGRSKMIAENCVLTQVTDNQLHLSLDEKHAAMLSPKNEANLAEALASHVGEHYKLVIETAALTAETPAAQNQRKQAEARDEALANLQQDGMVQQLQAAFGAEIDPDTVKSMRP